MNNKKDNISVVIFKPSGKSTKKYKDSHKHLKKKKNCIIKNLN